MKKNKLSFEILENEEGLFLNCNGGLDYGYMKPLQKNRDKILKEFYDRIKLYNGKLIKDETK